MMHKRDSRLLGAVALVGTLALSGQALAFCQTTTCLPSVTCDEDPEQCCIWDREGCDTNGLVITWSSQCASYAIQEDGSPLRDITAAQLSDVVDTAFATWMQADCGSTTPSIRFENFGLAQCDKVEINSVKNGPNASVWMFRDDVWPHSSSPDGGSVVDAAALALTTVTFNWQTGELLDADVEINSADGVITIDDDNVDIDLLSIVTHEAGHFLGLDHTNDTTATMAPGYVPHTTDQRSLALDDEKGICQSYPEGRETKSESCDPYDTFSPACASEGGCSFSGKPTVGRAAGSWLWPACALLLAAFGIRRRRAVLLRQG